MWLFQNEEEEDSSWSSEPLVCVESVAVKRFLLQSDTRNRRRGATAALHCSVLEYQEEDDNILYLEIVWMQQRNKASVLSLGGVESQRSEVSTDKREVLVVNQSIDFGMCCRDCPLPKNTTVTREHKPLAFGGSRPESRSPQVLSSPRFNLLLRLRLSSCCCVLGQSRRIQMR